MTEVVFIGTSDAFGAGGRRQSAVLLRDPRGCVLLDCGGTTLTGLNDLGIQRSEIDTILISHFHGDHIGGIPMMLLAALYEDGRTHPLHIGGPPQIADRVHALCAAMGHGLDGREWSFPLYFTELPQGQRCEVGPAGVQSFTTRHQPESHPHGYRVRLGEKTIAYSGDTGWFDRLPEATAGVDLFICECTLYRYVFDFHLSLTELEEHHGQFDCGRMILTHMGEEMSQHRASCPFDTADDGLILKL